MTPRSRPACKQARLPSHLRTLTKTPPPHSQQLHLTPDFPTSNVLVRNPQGAGEAVRSLYLVNDRVKSVLAHNDYTRMRLMTAGTKVITKQDAGRGMDAQFRILGEGLPVVLPYLDPERIMTADVGVLKVVLQTYYPLCTSFGEPFRSAIEARGKRYRDDAALCVWAEH